MIAPSPEAVVARRGQLVATLAAKPEAVLALPVGNTPRLVYAELAGGPGRPGVVRARDGLLPG